MAKPLTAVAVANEKPDPTKRREVGDSVCVGLRLVIAPTGAKSWCYRFKLSGKAGKLTIGGCADFTLKEARDAADDARRQVARGIDPAAVKQAARQSAKAAAVAKGAETVGLMPAVIDRYVADYADKRKSGDQIARLLRKELTPWARRHMASISRDDATELLEDIAARGAPVTGNRLRSNARKFWSWALGLSARNRAQLGLSSLSENPFALTQPPAEEQARDRLLSDTEIAAIIKASSQISYPFGPMIRLLAMTMARRNEVAGMEWSELSLDGPAPVWTIPAARTKNGRPHTIPLTVGVAKLLSELPRIANGEEPARFVFTTTGATPVSGFSRAKKSVDETILVMLRKAAEAEGRDPKDVVPLAPWTIHDLRRAGASGMARLGASLPVVERCLNHVSGSFGGIVGVYQRHDYAAEMRIAFAGWERHVLALETGNRQAPNVIGFKSRKTRSK